MEVGCCVCYLCYIVGCCLIKLNSIFCFTVLVVVVVGPPLFLLYFLICRTQLTLFSFLVWLGSPVTNGVRYILAGFCDYGTDPFATFVEMYNPVYDGYAYQAGFLTGDMIVGLEICEEFAIESAEKSGKSLNSTAATVNDCAETDETCANSAVVSQSEEDYLDGNSNTTKVVRRMVEITGDTTDEQWIQFAQSCEQLEPGADTVMTVRRRV